MSWVAHIATWRGPLIAITIAIVRGRKGTATGGQVDWFRFILYFTFLLSLSVVFTPEFDETARTTARWLAFSLLGAILIYKKGF